jgi:hypothetical protein
MAGTLSMLNQKPGIEDTAFFMKAQKKASVDMK